MICGATVAYCRCSEPDAARNGLLVSEQLVGAIEHGPAFVAMLQMRLHDHTVTLRNHAREIPCERFRGEHLAPRGIHAASFDATIGGASFRHAQSRASLAPSATAALQTPVKVLREEDTSERDYSSGSAGVRLPKTTARGVTILPDADWYCFS